MADHSREFSDPHNLVSDEILVDPYPVYHLLRYQDPVHWSEILQAWVLTHYEDILAVLNDPSISSAQRRPSSTARLPEPVQDLMRPIDEFLSGWVLNMDPPEHTRIRALVMPLFSQRKVEETEPVVRGFVNALLDRVQASEEMDIIADFAYPLPILVIAKMTGIPDSDIPKLMAWLNSMSLYFEFGPAKIEILEQMNRTVLELRHYLRAMITARRQNLTDDLIGSLIRAESTAEGLNEDQLIATIGMILFSAHESLRALIATTMLMLLIHPDLLNMIKQDLVLLDDAIEESLRYDGPNLRQFRVATTEFDVGGKRIHAGDHIILVLGAANRDPSHFINPDHFDITRHPNRHLAFGYGTHYCLGRALARTEAKIAIAALIERFPNLRLAPQPLVWRPHLNHRGLKALLVRL